MTHQMEHGDITSMRSHDSFGLGIITQDDVHVYWKAEDVSGGDIN